MKYVRQEVWKLIDTPGTYISSENYYLFPNLKQTQTQLLFTKLQLFHDKIIAGKQKPHGEKMLKNIVLTMVISDGGEIQYLNEFYCLGNSDDMNLTNWDDDESKKKCQHKYRVYEYLYW